VALATGAHVVSGLGGLAVFLYGWVPTLSGVAVSVSPIGRGSLRRTLRFGLVAALLMVGLDVWGAYGSDFLRPQWAYRGGEFRELVDETAASRSSWIATGGAWLAGDLEEAGEMRTSYPREHPRSLAAAGLTEFGLVLLALAMPVIVLAVGWWIRRHVRFDLPSHEMAVRVGVGWLISGALVLGVVGAASHQQLRALFRGGSLGSVLVPFVLLFLVGVVASWLVAGWERNATEEVDREF
jgi:hypothetical protein